MTSARASGWIWRQVLVYLLLALLVVIAASRDAYGQDRRVADLTSDDAAPVRLVGYGLVVGLDGTGDRVSSVRNSSGMTVQSVANLLKRFNVEVPAEQLRTQNAAAVLVTAEVSRYLRSGGRFTTHVSSIGDARSLKGGVLLVTPLVSEVGGTPVATAQGPIVVEQPVPGNAGLVRWRPASATGGNSASLPDGGVLETDLPRPQAAPQRLVLRVPDIGVATRIASAVNAATAPGTAKVEDAGSVALALKGSADEQAGQLARIRELRVRPDARSVVMVEARSGLVVAGGDVALGPATVRHANILIVVGAAGDSARAPASADSASSPSGSWTPSAVVRLPAGASVLSLADALHARELRPEDLGAVLVALQAVGALPAEVVIR